MIKYTYDHEIITMSTMFLNAMSDIVINRFNVQKEPRDRIKTRIVYAPKQRVLHDLLDRDQNIKLPVISVNISGISRDTNRVFNKLLGNYNVPAGSSSSYNEKMPLPVNINYVVTIMTRYQEDTDQILSHIIPYINPYFTVSWRTPKRKDHEIRSNVFWDGNVSTEYPNDLNSTQVARVVSTLNFTFQGWIFQSLPDEPVGNIYTIYSSYSNVDAIPSEYILEDRPTEPSPYSDVWTISAVPPQPKYIEPSAAKVGTRQQFVVHGGDGFQVINNVYLSGAPVSSISTFCDPFSGYNSLSGSNPGFFGVKLNESDWTYDRSGSMTFIMPSASSPGRIDVIIEGPAAYGSLIRSVRYNSYNPFAFDVTLPQYSSFIPYQLPYSEGIRIF